MPDDIIIMRNRKPDKICFVMEGTAHKLDKKHHVVDSVGAGEFCSDYLH